VHQLKTYFFFCITPNNITDFLNNTSARFEVFRRNIVAPNLLNNPYQQPARALFDEDRRFLAMIYNDLRNNGNLTIPEGVLRERFGICAGIIGFVTWAFNTASFNTSCAEGSYSLGLEAGWNF